jgi:DNA-binding CsgD family transcriptional regulator
VASFALTDGNVLAIEQICERLDGIPLAIELAAPRVGVLKTEQIAARLSDRFGLLSSGCRTALPWHRTLRAMVEWSHNLLGEPERMLMRRLAVFTGGWLQDALTLFRALGDESGIADTLVSLGVVAYFEGDWVAARTLYEKGLAAFRAQGNRKGIAKSLNDLGEVALEEGDLCAARRFQEESLTIVRDVGDPERVALALAALGGVAALQGEPERALRLGAASLSIRDAIGEPFSAAWQARFERWLEPARRALSDAATAAAWAEGATIPEEQAIAYALRPCDAAKRTAMTPSGPSSAEQPWSLTHREREVSTLVAGGLTNRLIATEMVITEGTAANYVQRVLAKLDFNTRA